MDADNPSSPSPLETPVLQFRTLGPVGLRDADGAELSIQPKRLALLVYLAMATPRGSQRRDTLLGIFWPEQDAESARGDLRQALRGLRQVLPSGIVVTRGEDVGLDRERIECGVWAFEKAVERAELERAASIYGAPFLTAFFLRECPEFEQWVDGERDRLARCYRAVLEQLAVWASERGDRGCRSRMFGAGLGSRLARILLDGLRVAHPP